MDIVTCLGLYPVSSWHVRTVKIKKVRASAQSDQSLTYFAKETVFDHRLPIQRPLRTLIRMR